MNKLLCDVLFASEKRKAVLLLLGDGAKEMEYLLKCLGTTRQALLPQMKILEEHHLISHYDDTYELTTVGKIIVDDIAPLLDTLATFDTDIEYWGSHQIDFIPSHLLKRMNELQNCEIVSPPLTDLYSFHRTFNVEAKMPDSVYAVTNFLYPDFYSIFTELFENNVTDYFIVSQELFDKIKAEYKNEFQLLIKNKNFKMYVYNKKMNFFFFTFDDTHLLLSLLKRNGEFDGKYLLCTTRDALEWAKELFEYCFKDSTPITEI
jgi:predicted transcriptional regulator